jgi:hypothetical protein
MERSTQIMRRIVSAAQPEITDLSAAGHVATRPWTGTNGSNAEVGWLRDPNVGSMVP